MKFCKLRHALSREDRLRRSYYQVLRDELDQFVLEYALVGSYENFLKLRTPYPFVELRELKPRARIPSVEFEAQNSFLIIFCENYIDKIHKKYIRYFDVNKTTKTNLLRLKDFPDLENYNRNIKCFESEGFFSFLKSLLPVDYAILIQPQPADKNPVRPDPFSCQGGLAHCRCIGMPCQIFYAISPRTCTRKEMPYAENNAEKIVVNTMGCLCWPAAEERLPFVAAQYFRQLNSITTIYVASSESRSLLRFDEKGVSKSVLIKLVVDEVKAPVTAGQVFPRALLPITMWWPGRANIISVFLMYGMITPAMPCRRKAAVFGN